MGRKKVLLAGYGLAVLLVFPLFHALAGAANPAIVFELKTPQDFPAGTKLTVELEHRVHVGRARSDTACDEPCRQRVPDELG